MLVDVVDARQLVDEVDQVAIVSVAEIGTARLVQLADHRLEHVDQGLLHFPEVAFSRVGIRFEMLLLHFDGLRQASDDEFEHDLAHDAYHVDHRVANIDSVASQALFLFVAPLVVAVRKLKLDDEYLQQAYEEGPEY